MAVTLIKGFQIVSYQQNDGLSLARTQAIVVCEMQRSQLVCSYNSRHSQLSLLNKIKTTSRMAFGESNGTPLRYSCLENPMDGGAWKAAVHGVARSSTRLSDFTFTFRFQALEKEMATHSSVLAWRIPGTGEPDGLPSMVSHRVGHD